MSGNDAVPGAAGVTGGGAGDSDIHGLKSGAQHPVNTPSVATTGSNAPSTVPATAGYSGGGASVSNEHGVATGKQYPGSTPQGFSTGSGAPSAPNADTPAAAGAGAATGAGAAAGGQAQQGSVIGGGKDRHVTTTPIAGATPGNAEKPSAQDKARTKTAVLAAGVQEDLAKLREKLTVKDGVQAPPPGSVNAEGQAYQPATQAGGKPSLTDKAKAFAVKAIDQTQAALEGAKQKVTKQTTAPASAGAVGSGTAPGSTGTGTGASAPDASASR